MKYCATVGFVLTVDAMITADSNGDPRYKAGQVCSWKIVADDLIAVDATVLRWAQVRLRL